MDNFTLIYKILATLDKNKGNEAFNVEAISPSVLGTTRENWEQLLIQMSKSGYIEGIVYTKGLSDKYPHITEPIYPSITIKGMEYLSENNMMAKARKAVGALGWVVTTFK